MTANDPPQDRLRALIVDDEPASRRLLKRLLADEPGIDVVGVCRDGDEAITVLGACPVDVAFLDIRMPGKDGFEVVRALERRPAIVFVTAYDTFAIEAFEVEAWDYLLKPYDEERLRATLARVRTRLSRERPDDAAPPPDPEPAGDRPLRRLAIPHGRGRVTVRVDRVVAIEAESNYARFHLPERSHLARASLIHLERRLDAERFVRVHRSWIVNVDHLVRQQPAGHGDLLLTMSNGLEVALSRRYRDRLEAVLESLS